MAKKRQTVSFNLGVEVEGYRDAIKAYNRLEKEQQKQVKAKVKEVAELMASQIRAAASNSRDPRLRALAATVRTMNQRVPVISVAGKTSAVVSGGASTSDLIFGMEFGAETPRNAWRFPPRTPKLGGGNEGYWIFPTARKQRKEVVELWNAALDAALVQFTVGGTNRKDGESFSSTSFW